MPYLSLFQHQNLNALLTLIVLPILHVFKKDAKTLALPLCVAQMQNVRLITTGPFAFAELDTLVTHIPFAKSVSYSVNNNFMEVPFCFVF